MSNASRRLRRSRQPIRRPPPKRPQKYSFTICYDPRPDCPTCRDLLALPGANVEEGNGFRTITVPVS